MKFSHKIALSLMFAGSFVSAQQTETYTNELGTYQKGMALYANQQYAAALQEFNKIESTDENGLLASNLAYYKASSAVRLDNAGGDRLMEDFVRDFPQSNKRKIAYLSVGNFYFVNSNYRDAKNWYDKVDQSILNYQNQDEFYFNYAYTLFKTNHPEQSQSYFEKVRNSQKYGAQAKYYIGYIAYESDNYEDANEMFGQAKRDGVQGRNMSYFQSDMNFKLGKFEKAIAQGKEQLDRSNAMERSQLNKIIGESYFNLEQYNEAIPYLKEYRGERGKWNNTDYYQLGFAYYKAQEYENAISEFNKIIDGNDFVAQNAYYHLAKSYLEVEKKTQALNAFKNASEMDFDKKIKKDAMLNYAKLSYEIGNNYLPVPKVLQNYLEAYPTSEEADQIGELLIDSYITSKQYNEAVDMLEGNSSFDDKKAYQKVTYLYAIELYKANEYKSAQEMFQKSLSQRIDQELIARATFWNAEVDYLFNNYNEALIGYKEFKQMESASQLSDIYDKIDYNIAYTYFKLKKYNLAAEAFDDFAKKANSNATKYDAYVRLGDSHFAEGSYWPAMESYNKAIAMNAYRSDYAFFQKAYSYGFVDKNDRKIEELQSFLKKYPKSIYYDDALYHLANTYSSVSQEAKAITYYERLINDYPKSPYYARSLSKQGLINYNRENYQAALKDLKRLVDEYPNSKEARQAVQTVRLVYIDLGQTEVYAKWVKNLDFVDVEDSDIDMATYEAAENKFLENETNAAIKGFKKYLVQFPNGLNSLNANFYLAQLLFDGGQKDESIKYYKNVVEARSSEFTEEALRKLSQIYLTQEDYKLATETLKRLEKEANFTQNIVFAQSNLMKALYEQKEYQETIRYADLILGLNDVDEDAKADAHIFTARSAIKLENEAKAKEAYSEVEKLASGRLKAEALYYNAYFKHEDGLYKESNKVVEDITKNYSRYRTYAVKAFYLMAKNYHELDDAYQASYILENIIKNFSDQFPDLAEVAQQKLNEIKAEEAKTNSSIKVEDNPSVEETED
ncbi:hypothetical protein CAP47_11175 [Psychroflexus sp. S27]|uniref:tetratricopeptide repeat protein n=1 Tax=Psychroflexus sp. S27 TaxID=1982757 RepID=UPI000CA815AE|nr:tetratricopeptide repeat protein [Psychroflexus sp. S27]PJX20792.1 hypothetical protein CAP47_11175 [Psychroflexus sp. S27]